MTAPNPKRPQAAVKAVETRFGRILRVVRETGRSAPALFRVGMSAVAKADLRRVKRARKRVDQARAGLREAIVAAKRSGETIRDIALEAGLSSTRVHELLRQGAAGRSPDQPPP